MSATVSVGPGEIRGRGISRVFKIRLAQSRSLKEAIIRRDVPRTRELWALRDVDVDVRRGEAFGIVGLNGSGKSTLLKLIAGIFAPSAGRLEVGGRVGSLIEIGAGFHPEFTGVENIYLNAAIYGLKRSYVDKHLDEIIDFAELEAFKDAPVRTYSSGMYMRLGFSVRNASAASGLSSARAGRSSSSHMIRVPSSNYATAPSCSSTGASSRWVGPRMS